jgi:galactokinase
MTGAALAAALVRLGLDAEERARKESIFDLVVNTFRALDHAGVSSPFAAAEDDVYAWWVPGRLEVFGTHTDYAGGHTLVCAVPRGFAVLARRRVDGLIRIVDAARNQEMSVLPGQPISEPAQSSGAGWRRYVGVVARRLARNFPGAALGVDIVLASDLPRASGMSSSSALVVSVATALVRAAALRTRPEWQRNIHGPEHEAGYYACMENGLSFGTLEGDGGVGTHGGSEDHAAILTATAKHLSALTFVPMRARGTVPLPASWRFVLTPSGVVARKAGATREAYNRLSDATTILLTLWNRQAGDRATSLRDALVPVAQTRVDTDRLERLQNLIRHTEVPGWSVDTLQRRLEHFVREDSRTMEALDAFGKSDADRLGHLADQSQEDAETLLGNQIAETIELAAKARRLGALAARSFGAGFGGSVWALVDSARAEDFARRWTPEAFVAVPGPPLVELTEALQGRPIRPSKGGSDTSGTRRRYRGASE